MNLTYLIVQHNRCLTSLDYRKMKKLPLAKFGSFGENTDHSRNNEGRQATKVRMENIRKKRNSPKDREQKRQQTSEKG